jgi:hypothetical protein
MNPQERGFEGISVYSYFNYLFLFKGWDWLHELLGDGQEVLDSPRNYLNPPLV